MEKVQEVLARNIRTIRETMGLSREQFSEAVGISPNYLSELEKAKKFPRPNIIDAISKGLKIHVGDLFKSHDALVASLSLETFALKVRERIPELLNDILRESKDGR
jgi:transcriptional regulator with XRE-family HTH domain